MATSAMTAGLEDAISAVGGGRSTLEGVTPELVGSKAYNLMRMDRIGLSVPAGFVLHTRLCRDYFGAGAHLPADVVDLLHGQVRDLEATTGLRFGDERRPLLVSVRSGAAVSMPGMMDTLLNIGLTDSTVHGLIRRTGNPHLAWDSYRRLVAAYTDVVDHARGNFDAMLRERLERGGLRAADELATAALRDLTRDSLAHARAITGHNFPQDPFAQLLSAVEAVFRSWQGERAVSYRHLHGLEGLAGTALIVQAMVFGNAGGTSGSGVGFTRNPSTGADELYFDFAFDAQGEDVVAGRHSPLDPARLARVMPGLYTELQRIRRALEIEFGDMQDFEFTVEDGRLFMLQTRAAKRTPLAAVRVAVALAEEGTIEAQTALARIDAVDVAALDERRLDSGQHSPVAMATPASGGVASGPIALDSAAAIASATDGETPILVRAETSTDDIEGFAAAAGVLTGTGGRTSHAAVIARQLGKACLVACTELEIDLSARTCTIGGHRVAEGSPIAIDGDSGAIFAGDIAVLRGAPAVELAAIDRLREKVSGGQW